VPYLIIFFITIILTPNISKFLDNTFPFLFFYLNFVKTHLYYTNMIILYVCRLLEHCNTTITTYLSTVFAGHVLCECGESTSAKFLDISRLRLYLLYSHTVIKSLLSPTKRQVL